MISGQSARKKIANFFEGILLYLLQVMLQDNDLRGALLAKSQSGVNQWKGGNAQKGKDLEEQRWLRLSR
jgi:hypothetical protein